MMDIQSTADLEILRERVDLERKPAAGRGGKGALPEDFWPTCSSFAKTEGGLVLLGVREKQGQSAKMFRLVGVGGQAGAGIPKPHDTPIPCHQTLLEPRAKGKAGRPALAFPTTPTHERQAYTSAP